MVISQFFIHVVISKFHQRSAIDPSFICYLFCTLAPKDTRTHTNRQCRFKLGTDKSDVQSHSHTKCAFQNTFLTVTKINALDLNESIETEGRQLPAAEQLHQLFSPLTVSCIKKDNLRDVWLLWGPRVVILVGYSKYRNTVHRAPST